MIKFFRNIRQNLLSEGKTVKYFKYAIGEIVLVVIGILIALQLNNLNENRKIEETRQDYYAQLLEDLSKDRIYIKETISILDSLKNDYDTYIKSFEKNDLSLNEALLNQSKLGYKSKVIWFNTNTIESLESTGEIKLISKSIRNKLIDLKRLQNRMLKVSDGNRKIFTDILKLLTMEIGSGTLADRLASQPTLAKLFQLEKNYKNAFIIGDTYQEWKIITEVQTLNSLKEILLEEDLLVNLINDELKK